MQIGRGSRVIEYSDPKNIHHGQRRMSVITGGPMPPNYEGMTVTEKQCAKDEYEQKRKHSPTRNKRNV